MLQGALSKEGQQARIRRGADRDMAWEVSQEAQLPRVTAARRAPTAAARAEHELQGHIQYRSWCRDCVAAKNYCVPHRVLTDEETADQEIAEVAGDYFYMGEEHTHTCCHPLDFVGPRVRSLRADGV